jgi:dihydrofolate synthase/folylpolyglutamate synthase
MDYEQSLQFIHSHRRFGQQRGLARIAHLLGLMSDPQDGLRFIHVAGTNGKGSVSTALQCAFTACGVRTGLYTSPYVSDFRERISIDGEMIPKDALADIITAIEPLAEKTARDIEPLIEFELITAAAFQYFRQKGCGAVVLEVGIGGRIDATNVIKSAKASVITDISYDHMNVLGDTLGKIAFEKCGIIKPHGVTITSPSQPGEALEVIERVCRERDNRLVVPDPGAVQLISDSINGSDILYRGSRIHIPLCGSHQINNFITAYETLASVSGSFGGNLKAESICKGFSLVRMPARFEIFCDRPLIIIDGGHNASAAAALAAMLDRYLGGRELTAVMGMCADKDYMRVIPETAKRAAHFIAVAPDTPRALGADITAEAAAGCCPDVKTAASLHEALAEGLALAGGEGALLVCGSFYTAGPARAMLGDLLHRTEK